jgi:hypothetical protein
LTSIVAIAGKVFVPEGRRSIKLSLHKVEECYVKIAKKENGLLKNDPVSRNKP